MEGESTQRREEELCRREIEAHRDLGYTPGPYHKAYLTWVESVEGSRRLNDALD